MKTLRRQIKDGFGVGIFDESAKSAIEPIATSVASKTTFAGALAGIAGWASQINWVGVTGIVVGVSGLLVNIYFQVRRDRREAALSHAKIEALKDQCDT